MKKVMFLLKAFVVCALFSFQLANISTNKMLIGKWQSESDSGEIIVFTKTKKTDFYGGEKILQSTYTLKNKVITVKDKETEKDMQYRIISLSKNNLVLNYLENGKDLKFVRVKETVKNVQK
jgi:ribosomal protein S8E